MLCLTIGELFNELEKRSTSTAARFNVNWSNRPPWTTFTAPTDHLLRSFNATPAGLPPVDERFQSRGFDKSDTTRSNLNTRVKMKNKNMVINMLVFLYMTIARNHGCPPRLLSSKDPLLRGWLPRCWQWTTWRSFSELRWSRGGILLFVTSELVIPMLFFGREGR